MKYFLRQIAQGISVEFQKHSDGRSAKPSRKHNIWSLISDKNFITFIMFGLVLIFWPFWSAEFTELPLFVLGI